MSKISWTDKTWNPVHGCTKTSIGCKNCYAERMSKRLAGRHGYPEAPDNFKVTPRPDRLEQPLKWRKPSRVFVCSMSDLFHDDVSYEFLDGVMEIIGRTPQHVYQLLTKRPARMLEYIKSFIARYSWHWTKIDNEPKKTFADVYPHVWLGVTIENQATADKRIPLLFQTPAAMRWISAEPLLGSIDLQNCLGIYYEAETVTVFDGHSFYRRPGRGLQHHDGIKLDFVITGGETGPGARPSDPDWFRSLRDQCQAAGVKFHFKQHGEWIKQRTVPYEWTQVAFMDSDGNELEPSNGNEFWRVGNKRAGHKLDGVEWREMPGDPSAA